LKKLFILLTVVFLLRACDSGKRSKESSSIDTANKSIRQIREVEESGALVEIRDLNIDFYSETYDQLITRLTTDQRLKLEKKLDAGEGDASYQYYLVEDTARGESLLISRREKAEYGVGEELYYLKNGELNKVRKYDASVSESWSGYDATEVMYDFSGDTFVAKTRSKHISTIFKPYTLNDLPLKDTSAERTVIMKQQEDMMHQILRALRKQ
jgi:hypothetical protein